MNNKEFERILSTARPNDHWEVDFKYYNAFRKVLYSEKPIDVIRIMWKALEIIKNKQVVIPRLLCWRGLSDYNSPLLPKYWLEQDEYDFLKEVLEEWIKN